MKKINYNILFVGIALTLVVVTVIFFSSNSLSASPDFSTAGCTVNLNQEIEVFSKDYRFGPDLEKSVSLIIPDNVPYRTVKVLEAGAIVTCGGDESGNWMDQNCTLSVNDVICDVFPRDNPNGDVSNVFFYEFKESCLSQFSRDGVNIVTLRVSRLDGNLSITDFWTHMALTRSDNC